MELAQSTDNTFSLDELATLTDVPRRTVRYYIELGLLEGAEGETRAARYTRRHLETLLQIRRLTAEGVALSRIKQRLAGEAMAEGAASPGAVRASARAFSVAETSVPYDATPSIEVRSHLQLSPGIELVIEPGAARLSSEQLRRFMREALDALARAREEKRE
jgi:DNA-binding transcriptional MerR regulator